MFSYKTTSINKQITVAFMLVLSVSLVIAGSVFVAIEYVNQKGSFAEDMMTIGKIAATRTGLVLKSQDKEAADEILGSLTTTKTIQVACLYLKHNQLFSSTNNSSSKCPETENQSGIVFTDTHVLLTLPIIYKGENEGRLVIQSSLDGLFDKTLYSIVIMIMIVLAISIIAYYFLCHSQKLITEPILNLAAVADKIANNKVHDLPETANFAEEINILYFKKLKYKIIPLYFNNDTKL